MNRKALEIGKSVLIILLAALMVYLFLMARFYSRGGAGEPIGSSVSGMTDSVSAGEYSLSEAARPIAAAVTTVDGRYAAVGDGVAVSSVYDLCAAPMLMEALGTAEESFPVDAEQWLKLLSGQGVYLAYSDAIPADALAAWLGADFGYGGSAVRILMASGPDDTIMLYLDDGEIVRGCATSAKYSTKEFSNIRPNGGRFVFELSKEDPVFRENDPFSLLLVDMGNQVVALEASNPLTGAETRTKTLEYLGLNPYADFTTFADGSAMYSDTDYRLEISDSCTMSLQAFSPSVFSGNMVVKGETSETTAVEAAHRLAKATIGQSCGQADIWLTSCEFNAESNEYLIIFSYFVNGIRIFNPEGDAARITINDGYISKAELCFRKYTVTEETSYVLSPEYAAAALPDSELVLVYTDGGGSTVTANWKG